MDDALASTPLGGPDRGLCQELVYGVVRWQAALDWLIARKTAGRTQKLMLQNLLRLGLYQIFWLERIPDHAAVHETVELARQGGFGPQSGFVNALLRSYIREKEPARALLADLKTREPAVGYSHPAWLVERWTARWGAADASRLMDWNNTPPRTFARVNTLKAEAGKLLVQWRDENVDYDFVRRDWLEENLVFELKAHPPLHKMPSFKEGCFYIQDPSTLLAVRELDPRPDDKVLDLCAAPGGKLTAIAQAMGNQGILAAHDTSAERLKLMAENCARLGVTCARPMAAAGLDAHPAGAFDKVLVDAPCSNTGVMRRRVELRWRIRPEEIDRLRSAQTDLLRQAARLTRTGGAIIYSTCSLEPEENGAVVEQFLRENGQFKLARERQLLPFTDGVDGAYVARLTRE